ncbi:PDR/VanB family oxidoreductase [Cupriavidus sp. IK-TO18]|uniref:PDR/VanB family oxidoreductase n=1 Tax=Cupriavidus sp. IK-TO18 TaxID=2782182 RepID=UPI0018991759|nr:PDR/VanB family oxidoreductase [Cupriavidus sp. IK-TO18]MBF6989183.1 oxidoreductase [Cupriavidus sp. IK-TO18]
MKPQESIPVRVAEIEPVTPLIKRFTLQHADGGALPRFSGGSHIVVEMQGHDRLHRNPYSLMSSPWDGDHYQIGVRRVDEGRGGSRHMHERVTVGSVLRVSAPVNLFPLLKTRRKHILIAGGIGITPFFSHLAELERLDAAYELHYAVRSQEHAGFAVELQRIAGSKLHLYVEEGGNQLDFATVLAGQPLGTDVYVCGPAGMIDAVRQAARAAGWSDGHVHWEQFLAPQPGVPFEAVLARSGITVQVGSEVSLLEAIEAAGVRAPYLCRGGACGQCELEVLETDGELLHRDHYLSAEERAGGRKLMPCVSRARCQRVVLAI